jgi:hypothetical protein
MNQLDFIICNILWIGETRPSVGIAYNWTTISDEPLILYVKSNVLSQYIKNIQRYTHIFYTAQPKL